MRKSRLRILEQSPKVRFRAAAAGEALPVFRAVQVDPPDRTDEMGTSTTADVKKLLALAERMGIPASEAMHQVREMSAEPEASDQHADAPPDPRRPAS